MKATAQIIPFPTERWLPSKRHDWLACSGRELLDRILDDPHPERLVRTLSAEDLFWTLKKIGVDDSLPLLALATEEQWEYLLDLETWDRDGIDSGRILAWLRRLGTADPGRLADWLFSAGTPLLSLLLLRAASVVVVETDTETGPPPGYFSLDGRYYLKALAKQDQEALEGLLKIMVRKDHEQTQALLYDLASLLPAEEEEELYRQRNGRLAEHGFSPTEEALAVYAPLSPAVLGAETPPILPGSLAHDRDKALVPPQLPLLQGVNRGLIAVALARIEDPLLLNRLRVEFAGLSNRVIAADGYTQIDDPEGLAEVCRRVGGILNLALENRCARDAIAAEASLRDHSLETLFRVGYGLVMDLHWEAERWQRESWFARQGWTSDFWGSPWGEIVEGLLALRPQWYDRQGQPLYRHFTGVGELQEAREILAGLRALDRLLSRLTGAAETSPALCQSYQPFFFNRWAAKILDRPWNLAPLPLTDARRFFMMLRHGEKAPPYRMAGFAERFVEDFLAGVGDFTAPEAESLRRALRSTWEAFRREYEAVGLDDLEGRFSPYLLLLRR